jgi:homoprotocatechuate degradation regulator HpaR
LTVADTKIRQRRSAPPAGAPPDVTGHPFKRSLPMLLMRAREAVMKRFRPHLRSHGVTEQQWRILRVLAEHEQVELLELSARCLIGPPSLSRTVPALAERGLVSREVHPDDGRRFLVSLTPAGRELFETMAAESARIYAELEGELAAAGLMAIYDMLSDLVDVLDPEELDE